MGSTGKSNTDKTNKLTLSKIQNMPSDEFKQFMTDLIRKEVNDDQLNKYSQYQKFVNELNLHDEPIVLDNNSFDKSIEENALDGVVLYRGVGHQNDTAVTDSIKWGSKFYVGNGIYGDGMYLSNYFGTARSYGNSFEINRGELEKSLLTAYIDKRKARAIDVDTLRDMMWKEIGFIDEGTAPMYAMKKGYNVIVANQGSRENYYIALTRESLVFRENARTPKSTDKDIPKSIEDYRKNNGFKF